MSARGSHDPGSGDAPRGEGSEIDWGKVFRPIPAEFFSAETDEPFRSCVECGRAVLDGDVPYMIQKCSNGRETVFEFAICQPCGSKLQQSYSDHSRKVIFEFLKARVDIPARIAELHGDDCEPAIERWISKCLTCGSIPRHGDGYSLVGAFEGGSIVFLHAPFRICNRCELALNELLSPETRGEWDRFVGRNFDIPPGEVVTPDQPKVVLV